MIFFGGQNKFFGMQEKKIWVRSTNFCRKFAAFWRKFCHLVAQVLLPYGKSFDMFWPPVLIIRAQFKSLLHLLGVGGVCVCRSLS